MGVIHINLYMYKYMCVFYIFIYKCTNARVLLLYLCINVQKHVYFGRSTCKYINMCAFLYIYTSAFIPTCVSSQQCCSPGLR